MLKPPKENYIFNGKTFSYQRDNVIFQEFVYLQDDITNVLVYKLDALTSNEQYLITRYKGDKVLDVQDIKPKTDTFSYYITMLNRKGYSNEIAVRALLLWLARHPAFESTISTEPAYIIQLRTSKGTQNKLYFKGFDYRTGQANLSEEPQASIRIFRNPDRAIEIANELLKFYGKPRKNPDSEVIYLDGMKPEIINVLTGRQLKADNYRWHYSEKELGRGQYSKMAKVLRVK